MGQGGFCESMWFIELQGKIVLIVGWGVIGCELGCMLDLVFGMCVLVYLFCVLDIGGYICVIFEEGLVQVDLILLYMFMCFEMWYMMNVVCFVLVKCGVILVNIVWQGLVDEVVLVDVLWLGQIVVVGLDIYEYGVFLGLLVELLVVFILYLGVIIDEVLICVVICVVDYVIEVLQGCRFVIMVNVDLLDQVGV